MTRTVRVSMICALALGLIACGSSDNGVSRKTKADDGRVLVRNETGTLDPDNSREVDLTVTYTDPNGTRRETVVSPGQVADVTGDELIEGGERVRLIIESAPSDGTYSHFKQTIRIRTASVDGNIEICIVSVRDGAQLDGTGFDIEG